MKTREHDGVDIDHVLAVLRRATAPVALVIGLLAVVVGCEDSGADRDAEDASTEPASSELPLSTASASTQSSTSDDAAVAECGNGVREGDEECDDDNRDDHDGCSRFCTEELCGNDHVDADEQCDPPGVMGCDDECQLGEPATTPVCGNGALEAGEQCDDSNLMPLDGCDALCGKEENACGNGTKEAGEACDDGDTVDGDGCESDCSISPGFLVYACGNGQIDRKADAPQLLADEECDDGNLMAGDGCSGICTIESDCGNGVLEGDEECDDPSDVFCSAVCTQIHRCGNDLMTGDEECDDGNDVARDGCTKCRLDGECGNGLLDWDEQCDGALGIAPGGFCDPVQCVRIGAAGCGDGQRATGEACDDGNRVDGDGCSGDCQLEACGNGEIDDGESCDDGSSCYVANVCGDGSLSLDEACDDGNLSAGDGCSPTCSVEVQCGDGVKEGAELCDDGNADDGDGCSADCHHNEATCGNGTVEAPEECDDGDVLNGDACSSRCRNIAPSTGSPVAECRNFDFNADATCWLTADAQAASVGWDASNVSGSSASGSLAVTFTLQTSGAQLTAGGAATCLRASPNSQYKLSTQYFVDADQPADALANVGVFEYATPDCTGPLTFLLSTYGSLRGAWGPINATLVTSQAAASVMLRLFVVKSYGDPATTVLFDGVKWDGNTPSPGCGDGSLAPATEECDDGNNVGGDGCDSSCSNENVCGDGIISGPAEDCEDGNFVNGDGCSSACKHEALCGDGLVEGIEQCDDHNTDDNDDCTNHCRNNTARCGDGVQQPGESCDTGDVCDGTCTATCTRPACGDWITAGNEQCDDGNIEDNDGCSARCRFERCGDGIIQGDDDCTSGTPGCEACDDHGVSDFCTSDCALQNPNRDKCVACERHHCVDAASACDTLTGAVTAGTALGVPRAVMCRQVVDCESAYQCKNFDECYCGSSEGCGNATPTGPCKEVFERAAESTSLARVQEQFEDPTGALAVAHSLAMCRLNACSADCSADCGNGKVEGDEECDSEELALNPTAEAVPYCSGGATDCNTMCTQACKLATCGDGVVVAPEECDDLGEDCDATCHWVHGSCGDGVVNRADGENCEANDAISDNCNPTCCRLRPFCGNAEIGEGCADDPVEECDDGNDVAGDGCDQCHLADASTCGGCLQANCNTGYYDKLLSSCFDGFDIPAGTTRQGTVHEAVPKAEVGRLCKAAFDCFIDTPDGQGRICGDYPSPQVSCFAGLGFRTGTEMNNYFLNQSNTYDDATGPCKREMVEAAYGVTALFTLAQGFFDVENEWAGSIYPLGYAGHLLECATLFCPQECDVSNPPIPWPDDPH